MFVLDASESEKEENFNKQKNFVYNFAKRFQIGAHNIQFSSVTFSMGVRNDFYLNTFHNRHGVLDAISKLQVCDVFNGYPITVLVFLSAISVARMLHSRAVWAWARV